MPIKKIDKEFCLTDSTVNCYGYRLLTTGLSLERFNPSIGFLMHDRDKGVAVRWEDFRFEGDKLFAKPVVNTADFPNLAEQIENGFYSAASVGKIVAIEMSDAPDLMLEGQKLPTVTKWFPRECSIVDIPGNYNALAQLYDENDTVLHDLTLNINNFKMKELKLPKELLVALNLSDDFEQKQLANAINDLIDKAKEADSLKKQLSDLKAESNKEAIETLLQNGMKDNKFGKELSDKLRADYQGNPQGLKDLIDAMPKQQRVTEQLGGSNQDLPEKFRGKSFNDLYLSGDLAQLKADYPDYYQQLKEKTISNGRQ